MFLYFIYVNQERKMDLSIRNAKAEKLAREIAAQSGENITQAIAASIRQIFELRYQYNNLKV